VLPHPHYEIYNKTDTWETHWLTTVRWPHADGKYYFSPLFSNFQYLYYFYHYLASAIYNSGEAAGTALDFLAPACFGYPIGYPIR
jgi:hypothetical protein